MVTGKARPLQHPKNTCFRNTSVTIHFWEQYPNISVIVRHTKFAFCTPEARRKSGVIGTNRASGAEGAKDERRSDGAAERRNVAAQELATEGSTASANYTKYSKFCLTNDKNIKGLYSPLFF